MSEKQITEFEIVRHGVEYSDYFQGCGIALTPFTDVATGIGNSEREAFNDALEQLAMSGWNVETCEKEEGNFSTDETETESEQEEHPWYHVSVRVK